MSQCRAQGRDGGRLANRQDLVNGQIRRRQLRVGHDTLDVHLMCSEDYIQTLGVNFMEKAISIRNTEITFSVGII